MPACGLDELDDPLLLREPSREEDVRRRRLLADFARQGDAVRDHANVARTEPADVLGERLGDGEHDADAAEERTSERRRPARELEIRPVHRDDHGRRVASATAAVGSQCACTTSASPAARRAARTKEAANAGSASASHGRLRRFPAMPAPKAIPKWRNDAGDTTSTSTSRARRRSTASATKRPAASPSNRG